MNVVLPSRQVQSRQMRLLGCVGLGQEEGLRQQKRMRARDSSWVHDSSRVQDISREYLREKRGGVWVRTQEQRPHQGRQGLLLGRGRRLRQDGCAGVGRGATVCLE